MNQQIITTLEASILDGRIPMDLTLIWLTGSTLRKSGLARMTTRFTVPITPMTLHPSWTDFAVMIKESRCVLPGA
jgi:hypothetical protein